MEKEIQNATETFLTCQRCFHRWKYKGKNPYVVTCPYCKTSVSMKKNRLLQNETQVGAQAHSVVSEAQSIGVGPNG